MDAFKVACPQAGNGCGQPALSEHPPRSTLAHRPCGRPRLTLSRHAPLFAAVAAGRAAESDRGHGAGERLPSLQGRQLLGEQGVDVLQLQPELLVAHPGCNLRSMGAEANKRASWAGGMEPMAACTSPLSCREGASWLMGVGVGVGVGGAGRARQRSILSRKAAQQPLEQHGGGQGGHRGLQGRKNRAALVDLLS